VPNPLLSFTDARRELRSVLDAADAGRPLAVGRRDGPVALVALNRFLGALRPGLPRPETVMEAGGWSILLPGLPIAADGVDLEEATEEFVLALLEYADVWVERLHRTPNHEANWALVQFVCLSDEDQLLAWVRGTSGADSPAADRR